jgi:hypothetical protein
MSEDEMSIGSGLPPSAITTPPTDQVDSADGLVAGHAKPVDGEEPIDRDAVRMADAARLHLDAYVAWWRVAQRLLGHVKVACPTA